MSSPSKVAKVNYLYIRYLRFRSVRGDFLEGHSYASRCLFPLFPVPIPGFPSTKSGFLCFLGSGTPVFWLFEHKIEVFVRFWPSEPPFSSISSTKSRFLCFFGVWNPHFRAFRAQNRGFCAQEDGKVGSESVTAETLTTLPSHLRRRTSAPAAPERY